LFPGRARAVLPENIVILLGSVKRERLASMLVVERTMPHVQWIILHALGPIGTCQLDSLDQLVHVTSPYLG
jgi:hypothetical protein